MPTQPYDPIIEAADSACREAARLRKMYRRSTKRGSELRRKQLTAAIDDLSVASMPLRSIIGQLPYLHIAARTEERLRRASLQLQSERRKLRKML
jgi:hypothetical protein